MSRFWPFTLRPITQSLSADAARLGRRGGQAKARKDRAPIRAKMHQMRADLGLPPVVLS